MGPGHPTVRDLSRLLDGSPSWQRSMTMNAEQYDEALGQLQEVASRLGLHLVEVAPLQDRCPEILIDRAAPTDDVPSLAGGATTMSDDRWDRDKETYRQWSARVNGPKIRERRARLAAVTGWQPEYERWRHGGWYVMNVCYPSGGVGCVSRNYTDRKWRIVTENTGPGSPGDRTFRTRDDAARAERELTLAVVVHDVVQDEKPRTCERCGDSVQYLSSNDLCDGCVAYNDGRVVL